MTALTLYSGRKGTDGRDGINGLTSSDIDNFSLENPLLNSLQPNSLSKNAYIQWQRDSVSSYDGRYGAGVFSTPATTTNYNLYSEDFTQWDDVLSSWSIIGATTDPFGGNDATEVELDTDTRGIGGTIPIMGEVIFGIPIGVPFIASFWIKRISGTIDTVEYSDDSDYFDLQSISDSWERKVIKVASNSASSRFGISPRGDSGARFAVYGVQFQQYALTEYIPTNGVAITINLTEDVKRQNKLGYLIEGEKQNLCHYTQDLAGWTITNGTSQTGGFADPFGFKYQLTRVVFSSLSTVTLNSTTETLTDGAEYAVSFWAYNSGGSITDITVSLGGGDAVSISTVSVAKFERITTKVISGNSTGIEIKVTSEPLTAQLNLCCFQIETGEATSYIPCGSIGQIRPLDLVFMPYKYNAPLPSGDWTFTFNHSLPNDNQIKTIFSNGEAGANEFSLTVQSRLFTINNGGNTTSIDLFDYKQIAIVYDAGDVSFYGYQELISTVTLGSTSLITTNMYIGSNGVDSAANGYLGGCMFYNEALSDNNIKYLLGV